ncbi:3ac07e80-9c2a-48f4-a962-d1917eaa64f3 [Sclerotinia trifoliorum]|uniref:3ac07e80-9c2a-48f4-a962-d1917eaa64f3 n=1 Tax=Sclerotinia trifoliorum TaxID=28548 RepID=A0A8H2ZSZ6_9HELO|nr:3ac07e80-9c2a-48f4-a962-d1917eaa64f3 [Sclerotinia trifoliorum]
MSKVYPLHYTFDRKSPSQKTIRGGDISNYIPLQAGRENNEDPTPFDVLQWLSTFYEQKVPPLPVVRDSDFDEVPDQRLQETMEEYQLVTPTVKKRALNPFIETEVKGFPLIEDTIFNIVRSYPADEQYNGAHNLTWTISNSYYRAVAWCIYGNWELWPHVKAQHRAYVNRVLEDEQHPRHELVKELNTTRKGKNNLNLKERLGIPYCGIRHEDIQQISADMYGVLLVIFTYRPQGGAIERRGTVVDQTERHYAPTIRGDFNRPHKFIRLSIGTMPKKFQQNPDAHLFPIWQIYEPMILNMAAPARASDFKYIKPSYANTKASMPEAGSAELCDGFKHPWRRIWGDRGSIPPPLTQPALWPAGIPLPKSGDLGIALGCKFIRGDPDNSVEWAVEDEDLEWKGIRPDVKNEVKKEIEVINLDA